MAELVIDPVSRLEGHHGVKLEVEGGKVVKAKALATMFRGFERIVIGRDPRDAPILLQRICGVCHNDHRLVSLMAIENAAGVKIPEAGLLLRNIIASLQFVFDHPVWAYALTGPDYCDAIHKTGLVRFDPITGAGVKEAVAAQRRLHQAMAYIGGKVPHIMTPLPGGMTLEINGDIISKLVSIVEDVKKWAIGAGLGKTALEHTADIAGYIIDDVTSKLNAGKPVEPPNDPEIGRGLYDLVSLILVMANMGLKDMGERNPVMLAYGFLEDPEGNRYFPSGFFNGEKLEKFDEKNISEDVSHSFYADDAGGSYVGDEDTRKLVPAYGKAGAYTWAKAPRYKGMAAEVGPLPRMVAKGFRDGWELGDPLNLRKDLAGGRTASNALARNIARIQEELLLIDYLERALLQLAEHVGRKTWTEYEVPESGTGVGLREAPRGALGHWVRIEGKKIDNYQVIAPTTWNVSPTDGNGNMGPLEEALIDTPVENMESPWDVVRVIHSFDLCLACTVHVFDGRRWAKIQV
jgi:hydrogenase large subunit